MIKNIYEVIEEINTAKSQKAAKEILEKNMSYAMRCVLRANYNPNVKFVIDKIPTYRPDDSPPGMGVSTMHMEINRLYLFEENNPRVSPNLTLERKKQLLIQILEGLESREAKVFADMILKRIKLKYLDREAIQEMFPDLFV